MHPQLAQINTQLDEVSTLAQQLAGSLLPDHLRLRPESESWSVAECLVHLNLCSEAFVQVLRIAPQAAGNSMAGAKTQFRMDKFGRLLHWTMRPTSRIKRRAPEQFQPKLIEPLEEVLPRFLTLQASLKAEVTNLDGLDLNKLMVRSPLSKWVKYNLYSSLMLMVAHQIRHLWQAEKAKRTVMRDR